MPGWAGLTKPADQVDRSQAIALESRCQMASSPMRHGTRIASAKAPSKWSPGERIWRQAVGLSPLQVAQLPQLLAEAAQDQPGPSPSK